MTKRENKKWISIDSVENGNTCDFLEITSEMK